VAAHWAGVCGDDGSSGCVGEEDWGLGAGEAVALIALTAACSGEGVSCGEDGEEMELGAGGGEEWSGVQTVVDSNSCGELGRERVYAWFGGTAGVGLGGDQVVGGGECGGGRDAGRHHSQRPSAVPPRSVWRHLGRRWLGRRLFGRRWLGPDLRCSGRQKHCSAGNQTASTRASAG
jgi:hypothetical protein